MFGKPQGLSEDEAMQRQKHVLSATAQLWKDFRDASAKWGDMTADHWDRMQKFLVEQKLLQQTVPSETLFTADLIADANRFDLQAVLKKAEAAK